MICQLCNRDLSKVTDHHLIPRTRHTNKKTQKNFTREQMSETIQICRPCHSNIHANITEKDLENIFNTLEKLLEHPEVSKFSNWIKNKPDGFRVQFKDSRNK